MSWGVEHGDCAALLRELPDECMDALVTDPPAGIGFMGKDWDKDKGGRDGWIAWLAETMREVYRVLKPGAHGLVWALPRTSHWTAMALELAGFEIRDRVVHLFGTGFPKSLNVGDGRGTALKPACEDWWLVRKPLAGTVAGNVAEYGTGALNIDACRIGSGEGGSRDGEDIAEERTGVTSFEPKPGPRGGDARGRWPAHVVLDPEAAAMLDAQTAELKPGGKLRGDEPKTQGVAYGDLDRVRAPWPGYGDAGGASRFFYCAKPSTSEREDGLDHLPARSAGELTGREDGSAGLNSPRTGAGRRGGRRNHHPTVKSIALMRWLVQLITPPGGVVLDPFTGSGTTGIAAVQLGCSFLGIEREAEYVEIARGRIAAGEKDKAA